MSRPQVEDIYQLSSMQEGMLFHSLFAPESGVYMVQYHCILRGAVDVGAFLGAWQTVVDRHAILRTSFQWQGLDKPVQVVMRRVEVAVEQDDWRMLEPADRRERLDAFVEADRRHRFDFASAPLMRLTLIRWAEDRHRLVWTFHHLLLDGWSLSLVLKDLFSIYEALAARRSIELEPPVQFGEYIGWLQGQDLAGAERYWRRELAGYGGPPSLGSGPVTSRAPGDGADYGVEKLHLPAGDTAALAAFAKHHHLTLNTLLQAAWAMLLSRYSGRADTVFGAIVAGRPADLPAADSIVGMFVNTLPVRAEVVARRPLVAWLQELQRSQAASRQFEFTPLAEVHSWSDVPASLPLFEATLCFENFPLDEAVRQPDLSLEIEGVSATEKVNYPLALLVAPGTSIPLEIHHDPRRFETALVCRMLGQLRVLLSAIGAAEGGRQLGGLPVLTAAEQQQLMVQWNCERLEYPDQACIHELIERQAARRPEAPAAQFDGREISYGELDRRANRLAWYLIELRAAPEMPIGLFLDRRLETLVGILAILKAGAAYLPIDLQYPQERMRFMLREARVPLILTLETFLPQLPEHDARIVCLDRDQQQIGARPEHRPPRVTVPENLAYVIYTSGSTGRPKGVQVPHRGLCNLTLLHRRRLGIGPHSRVLQFSSLGFDTSAYEILVPLALGACICLGDGKPMFPGPGLAELCERQRVNVACLPPSSLAAMPEAELTGLKTLIVAGEPCPTDLAERWSSGRRLFNSYGPTEASISAAAGEYLAGSKGSVIGRPNDNVAIYLVDALLDLVPIGVAGELLIGGVAPARGYQQAPATTAEKFVPDPFSTQPGGRLYRTGDLAFFLADGRIDFLGRVDHQLNIRGFRIEPAEVEAALLAHPAVRQAVVMAQRDGGTEARLAAFLVAANVELPAVDELRAFLAQRLPGFMIPATFTVLDALPLNASGKVDLEALAGQQGPQLTSNETFVAPRNELERTIAEICRQVMKIEQVGIYANFFDLGGHSLHLVQMHGKLVEALGRDLPLTRLFNSPSVSALAEFLTEGGDDEQSLAESRERSEARKATQGRRALRRHRRSAEGS